MTHVNSGFWVFFGEKEDILLFKRKLVRLLNYKLFIMTELDRKRIQQLIFKRWCNTINKKERAELFAWGALAPLNQQLLDKWNDEKYVVRELLTYDRFDLQEGLERLHAKLAR